MTRLLSNVLSLNVIKATHVFCWLFVSPIACCGVIIFNALIYLQIIECTIVKGARLFFTLNFRALSVQLHSYHYTKILALCIF